MCSKRRQCERLGKDNFCIDLNCDFLRSKVPLCFTYQESKTSAVSSGFTSPGSVCLWEEEGVPLVMSAPGT